MNYWGVRSVIWELEAAVGWNNGKLKWSIKLYFFWMQGWGRAHTPGPLLGCAQWWDILPIPPPPHNPRRAARAPILPLTGQAPTHRCPASASDLLLPSPSAPVPSLLTGWLAVIVQKTSDFLVLVSCTAWDISVLHCIGVPDPWFFFIQTSARCFRWYLSAYKMQNSVPW